jgi:hypothetical protein
LQHIERKIESGTSVASATSPNVTNNEGDGSLASISLPTVSKCEWMNKSNMIAAFDGNGNVTILSSILSSRHHNGNRIITGEIKRVNELNSLALRWSVIPYQYNEDAVNAIIEWVATTLYSQCHWTFPDLIAIVISYLI